MSEQNFHCYHMGGVITLWPSNHSHKVPLWHHFVFQRYLHTCCGCINIYLYMIIYGNNRSETVSTCFHVLKPTNFEELWTQPNFCKSNHALVVVAPCAKVSGVTLIQSMRFKWEPIKSKSRYLACHEHGCFASSSSSSQFISNYTWLVPSRELSPVWQHFEVYHSKPSCRMCVSHLHTALGGHSRSFLSRFCEGAHGYYLMWDWVSGHS